MLRNYVKLRSINTHKLECFLHTRLLTISALSSIACSWSTPSHTSAFSPMTFGPRVSTFLSVLPPCVCIFLFYPPHISKMNQLDDTFAEVVRGFVHCSGRTGNAYRHKVTAWYASTKVHVGQLNSVRSSIMQTVLRSHCSAVFSAPCIEHSRIKWTRDQKAVSSDVPSGANTVVFCFFSEVLLHQTRVDSGGFTGNTIIEQRETSCESRLPELQETIITSFPPLPHVLQLTER